MAEVSFLLSANTRKRASASREREDQRCQKYFLFLTLKQKKNETDIRWKICTGSKYLYWFKVLYWFKIFGTGLKKLYWFKNFVLVQKIWYQGLKLNYNINTNNSRTRSVDHQASSRISYRIQVLSHHFQVFLPFGNLHRVLKHSLFDENPLHRFSDCRSIWVYLRHFKNLWSVTTVCWFTVFVEWCIEILESFH